MASVLSRHSLDREGPRVEIAHAVPAVRSSSLSSVAKRARSRRATESSTEYAFFRRRRTAVSSSRTERRTSVSASYMRDQS
eukprot:3828402-Prymnesium_polylepis.3